jgi:hypothetical protein
MIVGALLAMLSVAATSPLAAAPPKTPARFVDNGDGTVTDNQTGLMWEQKTNLNLFAFYEWSDSGTAPDGPLFTDPLATMQCTSSDTGTCGLAGHYDWRLPNISELQTIVDCSKTNCLDPIFGPAASDTYWSATTKASAPTEVWCVNFANGNAGTASKRLETHRFRLVRGGR